MDAPYGPRTVPPALMYCLMTSESFGCYDFSRRRWVGLPDGVSCYFSLLEGAGPVTVVAAVVVWLHCTRGGVLLDEGWVHFG